MVRGAQEHRWRKCDKLRFTPLRVGAEALPLNHVRASTSAITRVADLPILPEVP
jgi:hypothetical protein